MNNHCMTTEEKNISVKSPKDLFRLDASGAFNDITLTTKPASSLMLGKRRCVVVTAATHVDIAANHGLH